MFKRVSFIIAVAAMILAGTASLAFGWGDGPRDGDHFGTHDWIIYQAAKLAGDGASWLDVNEACLASEEPDFLHTNSFLHTFRPTGCSQGGPQEAANYYYQAILAYKAGDTKRASHLFGVMSHYYDDPIQPMHSNTYTTTQATLHKDYETAVGMRTRHYWYSPLWVVPASRVPLKDIRARAVSAAVFSRGKASSLIYALRHNGCTVSSGTAYTITKECLSRAVNDLADAIIALPSGEGTAAPPAKIATKMSTRSVRAGGKVGFYVRCLDAKGNPVRAARVIFVWPTSSGTKTLTRYAQADGWVHYYMLYRTLPSGSVAHVRAYSTSSGKTTSVTEWFKLVR